jgi:rSAM/selenodomain-associated transferase 1
MTIAPISADHTRRASFCHRQERRLPSITMAHRKHIFAFGAAPTVAPRSHALVVMAKAPISGAVKSRLVPPLTDDEASALNRCFIRDVCASIEGAMAMIPAESNVRVAAVIAFTPAATEPAFAGLVPASFEFVEQRGEGLGARLINVAADLLKVGFDSVSLMNSDSPTIPGWIIAGAVTSLARPGDRIAIIGADDGGYCLIGLKRPHWRIFDDIAWSTNAVFAQTMGRVAELGLEAVRMPSWYDIDDADSLRRLVGELSGDRSRSQTSGFAAPATRAWLTLALANGLAARLGIAPTNPFR